jgi:DNA-binding NarL/FixJ family response regulator
VARAPEVIAKRLLEGMVPQNLLAFYLQLLKTGGYPLHEAAQPLGGIRNVEALVAANMAHCRENGRDGTQRVVANSVDVVLQYALAALAREAVADHERLLIGQQRMSQALLAAGAATAPAMDQLTRIVSDADETAALTETLMRSARRDWLTLEQHEPDPVAAKPAEGASAYLSSTDAKVQAIYEAKNAEMPARRAGLESIVKRGGQVRLLPKVAMGMKIADEAAALIPLTPSASSSTLLIQSSVIVGALREYFELLWERAVPFAASGGDAHGLSGEHLTILRLLVLGLTDEAVSEQVGVSVTTVRRRIASIRDSLGVKTRFQIGVAAVRRGMLD